MIFYIGPESKVYHLYEDCRLLNNAYRYYPIDHAKKPPDGRRACKSCVKREASS